MSRTSIYPFNSPNPLPLLPGQGADAFPPFSAERLLTSDEAAAYLRVEPRTLCRFITTGKLKASRVGRAYLIAESSLTTFLKLREATFSQSE